MDILKQLLNLPAKDLFTLGVIAAVITTTGNLLATFLKDFLLARSFESWKTKRSLIAIFRHYRDPILLSSVELLNRVREITHDIREVTHEMPANFLSSQLLNVQVTKMANPSETDPYFMKYKLISTIYRFCALLGWFELYRQEVTYLDSGKSRINRKLEKCIAHIRSDLADGYLNAAEDWQSWTDAYIFQEEQRAIGELMIQTLNNTKYVMGYGAFCELLLDTNENGKKQWLQVAANFIVDLDTTCKEKNFRYVRWLLLTKHLVDLVEVLDKVRVTEKLLIARQQSEKELENCAIRELHIASHRPRWARGERI